MHRSIRVWVGLQIDDDKFPSDHYKGRNKIVGTIIVEDLLSRLELEHSRLKKTCLDTCLLL